MHAVGRVAAAIAPRGNFGAAQPPSSAVRKRPGRLQYRLCLAHDEVAMPFAGPEEARAAKASSPRFAREKLQVRYGVGVRALDRLAIASPDLLRCHRVNPLRLALFDTRGMKLGPELLPLMRADAHRMAQPLVFAIEHEGPRRLQPRRISFRDGAADRRIGKAL